MHNFLWSLFRLYQLKKMCAMTLVPAIYLSLLFHDNNNLPILASTSTGDAKQEIKTANVMAVNS